MLKKINSNSFFLIDLTFYYYFYYVLGKKIRFGFLGFFFKSVLNKKRLKMRFLDSRTQKPTS